MAHTILWYGLFILGAFTSLVGVLVCAALLRIVEAKMRSTGRPNWSGRGFWTVSLLMTIYTTVSSLTIGLGNLELPVVITAVIYALGVVAASLAGWHLGSPD